MLARRYLPGNRKLRLEPLEQRTLFAADSATTMTEAIFNCLNAGERENPVLDLSADGWVTPLDALLAISSANLAPPQGEVGGASSADAMWHRPGGIPVPPPIPVDPAEVDQLFNSYPLHVMGVDPEGVLPVMEHRRFYARADDTSFKTALHHLGDDADASIYDSTIEFLNLPEGWAVTGKLELTFPVEKLARYDLRYRVVDADGHVSNEALLRLTFLDTDAPDQNPIRPFDVNDDGRVDYRDLRVLTEHLAPKGPQDPQPAGIICAKYCDGWEPLRPGPPLGDVNGDGAVNSADVAMLTEQLENSATAKLAPVAHDLWWGVPTGDSRLVDGGLQIGRSELKHLSMFGEDPDGDDRSISVEILSESPFTLSNEENVSGFVRITPKADAMGEYTVRYRLRDIHGLVSEEREIHVFVYTLSNELCHNAAMPEDVNGDGFVTPLDVAKLIEALNYGGQFPYNHPTYADLDWDVNADGSLSPLDALLIIIRLNHHAAQVATDPIAK